MSKKKNQNAIKVTAGEQIFQVFDVVLMFIISLIFVVPFWTIITSSLADPLELSARGSFILWPHTFYTGAYKALLAPGSMIYSGYKNTIIIVVCGTFLDLLLTSMMAYGLSKKAMPGRTAVTTYVFITMLFGGGLIPSFLLNKSLGLVNTRLVLILGGMVSPWNMFIMRNFFMALPDELEDAAAIDGCNPFKTLIRIILPISLPVMMTIGLFYAVGHWNGWFGAMIYINDNSKLPVQNILRSMLSASGAADVASSAADQDMKMLSEQKPLAESVRSASIIICTLPIMCIYPFIQKYFVKGVLVGSIKG